MVSTDRKIPPNIIAALFNFLLSLPRVHEIKFKTTYTIPVTIITSFTIVNII